MYLYSIFRRNTTEEVLFLGEWPEKGGVVWVTRVVHAMAKGCEFVLLFSLVFPKFWGEILFLFFFGFGCRQAIVVGKCVKSTRDPHIFLDSIFPVGLNQPRARVCVIARRVL